MRKPQPLPKTGRQQQETARNQRGSLCVMWGGASMVAAGLLLASIGYDARGAYPLLEGLSTLSVVPGLVTLSAGSATIIRPQLRTLSGVVALGASIASIPLSLAGFVAGFALGVLGSYILLSPYLTDVAADPIDSPNSRIRRLRARWRHRNRRGVAVMLGSCAAVSLLVFSTYSISDFESALLLAVHPSLFDFQVWFAFRDGTRSLSYDIRATPQMAACSYGVAYLLNGYTNTQYWYQVGLASDWSSGVIPSTGFQLIYEVFDPSGVSVYGGQIAGAGTQSFSGPVTGGDLVQLDLAFMGNEISFSANDVTTGSSASTEFQAEGGTAFGNGSVQKPWGGVFTGLMTECYRKASGSPDLTNATYTDNGKSQPGGQVGMDEMDFSWGRFPTFPETAFYNVATGYLFNSPALQNYTFDEVTTWSDSTEFSVAG
jgi:hypothetical protein